MNKSLSILFEKSQLDFSQIYLLSDLFCELLNSDFKKCKQNVTNIEKQLNNSIFEVVKKKGYQTIVDFKILKDVEPQLHDEWFRQTSIDLSLVLNKGILKLSEVIIPTLLWHSIYAYSYAHFENNIKAICFKLSDTMNVKFELTNDNRSLTEQIKPFLSSSVNFDFKQSQQWSDIRQYQNIRNIILHNGGYLGNSKRSNQARLFIKSIENISIDNSDKLVLTKEFVQASLIVISDFFQKLEKYCHYNP